MTLRLPRPGRPLLLLALLTLLPSAAGAADAALPTFGTPHLVADLEPGPRESSFRFLLPTPHGAVFLREPEVFGTPPELWTTDGTTAGTRRLEPPNLAVTVNPSVWLTGRYLYFEGTDTDTGLVGIWRTDGTPAGTIELAANLVFANPRGFGDDGSLLFFAGPLQERFQDIDLALWISDGTAAGTHQVKDVLLSRGELRDSLQVRGGTAYYLDLLPNATSIGLWKTDGTTAGTVLVKAPGADKSFQRLWQSDAALYLTARHYPEQSDAIWTSDGTAAGTHEVLPLGTQGPAGSQALASGDLQDGRTTFVLSTGSIPASLWVSDGTSGGTHKILGLAADSSGLVTSPPFITRFGGHSYFVADDGTHGREIWQTDGTPEGTAVALETAPGNDTALAAFGTLGDRLFLELLDPEIGIEPRVTDDLAAGTHLLGDLCPGPCSSDPFGFSTIPGGVLFVARDAESLDHLWASDLTAAGTSQVTSLANGIDPEGRRLVWNDQVFFVADDGVHGRELWSLPFSGGSGGSGGLPPEPPPGPWLSTAALPGFEAKVRITPQSGAPVTGTAEPACIPETLCVSGAVPGRSEVFVRVVGPKPNGYLWPTLVKFSTSQVEVWIRQPATGIIRYYLLDGASPGVDELPGLFDRMGFEP